MNPGKLVSVALPEHRAGTARSMTRLERAYHLYRKRIARCRTVNQLNQVHIALANYMTPEEVRFFGAALAQDPVDSPSRQWIDKMNQFIPTRESWPAEFQRKGILKGMTLYTSALGSCAGKTLIIGFTGNFHRLMLPLPVLLGCMNPTLYDVVVLRDFSRRFFSKGVPGLGTDFFQALQNLRNHVDPTAYRNCVTLGTSSGGLPAVLGAILLKLNRGVSIGGLDFPLFAAKLQEFGVSEEPYASLLASRPEPFPELLLVFGAGYAADVVGATGLHRRVPSRLLAVKACDEHMVLAWKLVRGRLPAFLSTLLGQSVETGERVSPSPAAANDTVE